MRRPFNSNFVLTQTFGNKFFLNGVDVYAQYGLNGHNGLDYGTPTGTEILAPHDGKIIEAADEGGIGYGKYLKVENAKEGSVLAHLKDFTVQVGNNVIEGQVIGHSDNTGNSTGPHLHWGYYKIPRNRQNGYAGFIDQLPLLQPALPDPMATITQKELDQIRTDRDNNWKLYQTEKAKTQGLTTQVGVLQNQINVLTAKINNAKAVLNG